MKKNRLIEEENWDEYWEKAHLPIEIKKEKRNSSLNEILRIFDEFFPKKNNLSILEIGGAPGQYLAYLAKKFGYRAHALDYSKIGCDKTRENLDILGVNADIYKQDLFSDRISELPSFDIVYSLGFVEHFLNLEEVVERHLRILKTGGILLIGIPNFLGINYWIAKIIEPKLLSQHNLSVMDIENWKIIEERFNLETIFKGYIGGFEPKTFIIKNNKIYKKLIHYFFAGIGRVIDYFIKPLRTLNSKYWSRYIILIYKK